MAWRILHYGEQQWNVSAAAERRANAAEWCLVLAFRAAGENGRAFWAPYPLESASKAALFAQAERIPNDRLAALLTERLG